MLRKIGVCLTALLCALLIYSYYSIGMANAHFFGVKSQLEAWNQQGEIESQSNYTETVDTLEYVLQLDPHNPHYWHIKGKVIHWGVFAGFESSNALQEAKNAYLKAIELRKTWPSVWGDLALINNVQEGVSPNTIHYIDQALLYGPYEAEVILAISDIYLANWDAISGEQKQQFFSLMPRLGHKSSSLFTLAKKHKRMPLICGYIKYAEPLKYIHSSYLYKRNCS